MRKLFAIAVLVVGVTAMTAAAWGATRGASKPVSAASAAKAVVKCGTTRTIGLLAPITGPAASIGILQVHWVDYFVSKYNKTHKTKLRVVKEDTQLGGPNGTAQAVAGAQSLASNSSVLGVVGPAGSNEVKVTAPTLKGGGLGFISGSATNTAITTTAPVAKGFFFRTVPPDSEQSKSVSAYIIKKLKLKRVYIIDDQEAYSTGLADEVQAQLKAAGVSVTRDGVSQQQADFSSLIAKIPRDTQLVYLPWQLPPRGQAFGQQMKQAGKGSIKLMGSDGLFDPAFAGVGSNVYDSFFPVNPADPVFKAFSKAHGGDPEYFGSPSYVAAQVVSGAVDRACAKGSATRASVRAQIKKTNLKTTLLGLPLRFDGNGDMKKKPFGVYHSVKGKFVRVA
jgi:branched-chain amino acid transport system substrate-binding protein